MAELVTGFTFILFASLTGGAFGLQYRVQRIYTVENSAFLSMLFATIVVPLIAIPFILPGWATAIREVGFATNLLVFALGFGWGIVAMGILAYANSFV